MIWTRQRPNSSRTILSICSMFFPFFSPSSACAKRHWQVASTTSWLTKENGCLAPPSPGGDISVKLKISRWVLIPTHLCHHRPKAWVPATVLSGGSCSAWTISPPSWAPALELPAAHRFSQPWTRRRDGDVPPGRLNHLRLHRCPRSCSPGTCSDSKSIHWQNETFFTPKDKLFVCIRNYYLNYILTILGTS